jgi:hypothetical protein
MVIHPNYAGSLANSNFEDLKLNGWSSCARQRNLHLMTVEANEREELYNPI